MSPRTRQVLRGTSSIVLVLAGIGCLYFAAFHAWVTATPTPEPEWHRSQFSRFGLAALGCFVLAGATIGWLRPPPVDRRRSGS